MKNDSIFRVGLDADSVIFDGAEMKSRITYELFGLHIPPEIFSKRLVFVSGKVTSEQYNQMKHLAYNTEIALTFKFVPGAKEIIQRMIVLEWFTPVITNRKESATHYIRRILTDHGLDIPIHSNGDANISASGSYADNTKIDIINRLGGLDAYVDDDLSKLEPLVGLVPNLILFSQPFNQDECVESIGALRIEGWENLFDCLVEISTVQLSQTF